MPGAATYFYLFVAILAEVAATTALARTNGFTRVGPSVVTMIGYAVAFYFLALTLRVMPTGVVYAVWSGLGIVLIAAVAWIWQGQRLDPPAVVGLGFIITGVLIVNFFSASVTH